MKRVKEEWRDIKGYEGLYQVSNLGRVKCISRYKVAGKIKKPTLNSKTLYLTVHLMDKERVDLCYIHRLVAEAFIPNPNHKLEVNHINEIRYDNRVENLEWCDSQYNNEYSHGKPVNQYDLNGTFIRRWNSSRHVKRELGFDDSHICKACHHKIRQAYGYRWEYAERTDI